MRLENGTIRHLRRSINLPGHAHELTFSCYRGLPLLSKDRTRQWLIEALDLARSIHHLDIWAYVIMLEHAHVLLVPQEVEYEMAAILKTIKQSVSRRAIHFVRTHATQWLTHLAEDPDAYPVKYHFWQPGGGYDRNIVTARAAHSSVDYIHANPVRRGLADAPAEWPWSSARWYEGGGDVKLGIDSTLPWLDP
ncbi:MAG: hypothetical protein GY856_53275 [bacterium]|nr:hypothetical protein [bacterium]